MAAHKVLTIWEEPGLLERIASEIDPEDPTVSVIAQDLLDTFHAELASGKGIAGLAANEIGHDARVILLLSDLRDRESCEKFLIVNPIVTYRSGDLFDFWCGCGSVPGYTACVSTDRDVTISGTTPSGEPFSRKFHYLNAGVASHEVDHLNAKTIWTEELLYNEDAYEKVKHWRERGVKMHRKGDRR